MQSRIWQSKRKTEHGNGHIEFLFRRRNVLAAGDNKIGLILIPLLVVCLLLGGGGGGPINLVSKSVVDAPLHGEMAMLVGGRSLVM